MTAQTQNIFQDPPEGLDDTWDHGALLGGMAEDAYDAVALAESFKLAGDILVQQVPQRHEAYELIYPILQTYRHSMELYLKAMLGTKPRTHDLVRLADELDVRLRHDSGSPMPSWMRQLVLEFAEFDTHGTTFRYPEVGVKSRRTGDTGEFWVSLVQIQGAMASLQTYSSAVIAAR